MVVAKTTEQKMALFNAAMGVTIRLNSILNDCWRYRTNLDSYGWYHSLISLQLECLPKLDKVFVQESERTFQELIKNINLLEQKRKNGVRGIPNNIYMALLSIEKKLRIEADNSGLLIPDKKDVMDMMKL